MWVEFHLDDAQFQAFFTYAGYKVRDARLPLTRVAYEVIRPGIEEQFATEGARTGGWKPLSPEYDLWKMEEVGDKPILQFSGRGKEALLAPTAFRIHKTELIYNPNDPGYMHWHQTGGYKLGKPPQRQIVTITHEDEMQIERIFTDWLDFLRVANRARPSDTSNYFGPMPGWSIMA